LSFLIGTAPAVLWILIPAVLFILK